MHLDSSFVQWQIPRMAVLASGSAYGKTALTAFDNALLCAGIGDLNLIKVSSVLPPGAQVIKPGTATWDIPKGALIPTVYTSTHSSEAGRLVSSAIGLGLPKDPSLNGMIFEASLSGSKQESEAMVRRMVEEAFENRNIALDYSLVFSAEAAGRPGVVVCTVAAVLLL